MPSRSLALSLRNVYETLAISWPTVVDAALGRVTKRACDERLLGWGHRIVANAGMELTVEGSEHYDPAGTYVVMSNHQSHYDIPVLFHILGGNLRMVTKVELFRVPVFGKAMREAGFIAIDRKNRHRAVASLQEAQEVLRGGVNVWIAPEGTRSRTGELGPLKKGGFAVALQVGFPILPVAIQGTRDVLPADKVRSRSGIPVRVSIAPPIDVAPYVAMGGKTGRDRLMADVREAIASRL